MHDAGGPVDLGSGRRDPRTRVVSVRVRPQFDHRALLEVQHAARPVVARRVALQSHPALLEAGRLGHRDDARGAGIRRLGGGSREAVSRLDRDRVGEPPLLRSLDPGRLAAANPEVGPLVAGGHDDLHSQQAGRPVVVRELSVRDNHRPVPQGDVRAAALQHRGRVRRGHRGSGRRRAPVGHVVQQRDGERQREGCEPYPDRALPDGHPSHSRSLRRRTQRSGFRGAGSRLGRRYRCSMASATINWRKRFPL